MGFCNNKNICQSFLKDNNNIRYVEEDLLQYRKNKIVPFYKFIQHLSKKKILDIIYDKNCDLYKMIEIDNTNYKLNIGKELDVDYKDNIDKQKIKKYADDIHLNIILDIYYAILIELYIEKNKIYCFINIM